MLLLILAHGHAIDLIEQDICCHKRGIVKKPDIDIFRIFGGFVFKLRHSAHIAHRDITIKYPRKRGVLIDLALDKKMGFLRINPAG